jgi:hypothetical protein
LAKSASRTCFSSSDMALSSCFVSFTDRYLKESLSHFWIGIFIPQVEGFLLNFVIH